MGHEKFTHRFNFEKQQSTTVTFIFSLIKILLLKFSPLGSSAFSRQIYKDWELKFFLSRSTVACNKFQLDFDFLTQIMISLWVVRCLIWFSY